MTPKANPRPSATRRHALGLLLGVSACLAGVVQADTPDPAVAQVQTLSAALLKSMKAGRTEGAQGRYRLLAPVIEQTFALPLMTRLAVGPDWAKLSPEQQQATIAAFSRFTIANYAFNFNEFDGQRFEIDPRVETRGQDKVVRTRILANDGTSNSLLYRMREVEGRWKVLDVYANGVSQLILRRTDFVAAMAGGGAPGLIAYLQKAADDLMRK